jgi:hypothetical protein
MASSPPNLPNHGGQSKPHPWTKEEGDEIGFVFNILLGDFEANGFFRRITRTKEQQSKHDQQRQAAGEACDDTITFEELPSTARNPERFHTVQVISFHEICGAPFVDLPENEQRAKLSAFLLKKFSVDPKGKVMTPPGNTKWRTLSWPGFFVTDIEAAQIVDRVVTAYRNRLTPA